MVLASDARVSARNARATVANASVLQLEKLPGRATRATSMHAERERNASIVLQQRTPYQLERALRGPTTNFLTIPDESQLHSACAVGQSGRNPDGSDGLFRRASRRPSDTGNRDSNRRSHPRTRPFGHF